MAFFNLGKKDQYGKQRRIEHRAKNLRISRTGGVALRTQVKAAGLIFTANSQHGLRVSTALGKGTQVALQNGRLVLRGRYGRGPTRLNLSKTGVSISTRNPIGTFNWIKPKRSSVKIAGVQLRGKNAANIQMIYMLSMAVALGLQVCWQALAIIWRGTGHLLTRLLRWLSDLPTVFNAALEQRRNKKISSYLSRIEQPFDPSIEQWTQPQLRAALLLILTGWGRGISAQEAQVRITLHQQQQPNTQHKRPTLDVTAQQLDTVAQRLEQVRSQTPEQLSMTAQTIIALLAQQFALTIDPQASVEALLNSDDWVMALGERTVLQEQLVQIFADFAQLRVEVAETDAAESNEHRYSDNAYRANLTTFTPPIAPVFTDNIATQNARINLNTASFEQLQALPHIGFDRALDILALRPITDLSQLTKIKGIGPARLADIQQAGVEL